MGKVLHQGCKIQCELCEGAISCPAPANTILKVRGQSVLLPTDEFTIDVSNCLFPKQGEFPPCVAGPRSLQWQNTAQRLGVNGTQVVLQSSTGTFTSPLNTPVPVVVQDSDPPTPALSL